MCVISYVRRGCFKEEEERRKECGSFYVLTTPAMFTVFVIYCYVVSNERVNYRIYISTDVEDFNTTLNNLWICYSTKYT